MWRFLLSLDLVLNLLELLISSTKQLINVRKITVKAIVGCSPSLKLPAGSGLFERLPHLVCVKCKIPTIHWIVYNFSFCLCVSRAAAGAEGLSIQGGGGRLWDSHHVLWVFSHIWCPDACEEEEEAVVVVVIPVTQSTVSLFILRVVHLSRTHPSACALLLLLLL